MSSVQNLVQFAPTPGLGQPLKGPQPGTLSCRINPSSVAAAMQVGSPMKLIALTTTGEIIIDLAGATDPVFGIIPLNTKKNTYAANDIVDLFTNGNILMLESAAAISAGALLAIGNTSGVGGGPAVTTATTAGAQVGGVALTSVSGSQQLVVVKVQTGTVPSNSVSAAKTFTASSGAATVSDTSITANSTIEITLKTVGGTKTTNPYVATITPGTGFTVAGGGASDSSVYNYRVTG